jgi:hypothetical protein
MESYTDAICALFKTAPQSCRVDDDSKKVYVAIQEDDDWWKNKCVLRDSYFNYEACKKLGLECDCESYGVYVFWKK